MAAPELWPFQATAVEKVVEARKAGAKIIVLCSPTGSGKSIISSEIIRRAYIKGARALHIVHRRKLVEQFSKHLNNFEIDHGILMHGRYRQRNATIQVASRDTLKAVFAENGFADFPPASLVVVDEGRHAMAPDMRKMLKHYEDQGATILLVDATPVMKDGKGLGPWAEAIVEAAKVSELIRDGFLVPMRVYAPDRKGRGGKYVKGIAGDLVSSWKEFAEGQPTVLFTSKVAHSKDAVDAFLAAGINAAHVDADTHDDDRDVIFEGLKTGMYQVVSNVGIIKEGVDLPELGCTQFYMDPGSRVMWLQACLDSETEVLSRGGWLRHETISPDDMVATFDEANGSIHWCLPEKIFSRELDDSESMHSVCSPHLDIRVSSDHSMIYRCNGKDAKNWRRRSARAMSQSGSLQIIPVAGIQQSAGLPLSDDELRFIGWYMTDGTHTKDRDSVRIYQSSTSPYNSDIEKCLRGCRFRFTVSRVKRTGKWAKYADGLVYCIAKSGWPKLRKYLDKNLATTLEDISPEQLHVLLLEMRKGDGVKRRKSSWTEKTMNILTSNRLAADRLQSLCVRRGFRCNISTSTKGRNLPLYTLRICPGKTEANIGSSRSSCERSSLMPDDCLPGEVIWCMTTAHGSLVTRRNGKVAIVGNCGRSMRRFKGNGILLPKKHGIVIDHAGSVFRHGFPDEDTEWTLEGNANDDFDKKKKDGKTAKAKYCGSCQIVYKDLLECPQCGGAPVKPPVSIFAPPPVETTNELLTEAERSSRSLAFSDAAKRAHWIICLQVAKKRNGTFGMAAKIYIQKYNEWPGQDFHHVPSRKGWKAKVGDVLPNLGRKNNGGSQ